jgi:hypothetical protein
MSLQPAPIENGFFDRVTQAISVPWKMFFTLLRNDVNRLSNHRLITSDYTMQWDDRWVTVNTASGDVTITLPEGKGTPGRDFWIKKLTGDTNTVNLIAKDGATLEGVISYPLNYQDETAHFVWDGTDYRLLWSNNNLDDRNTGRYMYTVARSVA